MKNDNIIQKKSYAFALEIIKLYKYLIENREYVLSKQIARSGTAIGACVREAESAESKRDFIHKLGIAVKEARETGYWLELLKDSEFLQVDWYEDLKLKVDELIRILNSIIITTREKHIK